MSDASLPPASAGDEAIVPRLQPESLVEYLPGQPGSAPLVDYVTPPGAQDGWRSFSTQRHLRQALPDPARRCVWLATWGGVLCWQPEQRRVLRYTSPHGLCGNATRRLAMDPAGNLFAAGESGGLSILTAGGDRWQPQPALEGWLVLAMIAAPGVGVLALARDSQDTGWLLQITPGELVTATDKLVESPALRLAETMARTPDGSLWIAGALGLHQLPPHSHTLTHRADPPEGAGGRISVIAPSGSEGLWLGAPFGLYHFDATAGKPTGKPAGTYRPVRACSGQPVLDLLPEANGLGVWVALPGGVGRLVGGNWQPAPPGSPPAPGHPLHTLASLPALGLPGMPEVCAAGPGGLFLLRFGRWDPAFSFATEDAMPASLQCLWADEAGVWAGGAGGLALWDGERWDARNEPGDPALRDVRSLAAPAEWRSDQLLWAAEWPGGLRRISLGFYVPRRLLNLPLAALAPLPDGRMWAASSDQLYLVGAPPGLACAEQPVLTLAPPTMIHTLCADGHQLWIGSSLGLGRISASDVHYAPVTALEGKPVLALARHPQRGEVWAGGPGGLYAPPDYQRLEGSGQVLALAFSAQGKLWVGTPHGLESWSVDEQRRVAKYDPHRHGLAAGRVACLVVRQTPRGDEIWVGTPAGVSCFTVGG